jgi:adenosylcobinamide amidohydrolase
MMNGWPTLSDDNRLLTVRLGGRHRTLSWAVYGGGLGHASAVVWRRVGDDELGRDVDPARLVAETLRRAGLDDAVGLLTARDLTTFDCATRQAGEHTARAVATVGLGNALSVGDPPLASLAKAEQPEKPGKLEQPQPPQQVVGTINLLLQVTAPLGDGALIELLALAAEARTAAVLEGRVPSRQSGQVATGTGTDCIVVAAPDDGRAGERYAGKHTALGALAGKVVREAVSRGVHRWIAAEVARGVQGRGAAEASVPSPLSPSLRSLSLSPSSSALVSAAALGRRHWPSSRPLASVPGARAAPAPADDALSAGAVTTEIEDETTDRMAAAERR